MGIVDEDIAKIRTVTDIVAVIAEHTDIKRSGRQWMARCPLHGERTPSLSVSGEKGVYHCFGCGRSGDAITFVREVENLDFVGAVEHLAKRAGVTLRYTSRDESAVRARKHRLLEAVAGAVEFYHRRLLVGDDAGRARGYLRSRGYDSAVIRKYRIGWAPDGWDPLARHLDLSDKDLLDSGLGFVNSAGRQQDFFRARVLFPIVDERGDPVGFGGRALPGSDGPKYKNTSSDAVVYEKSKVLYGLHDNREEIVRAGEAIVCEGYTDVIGFAEAGIGRAVATCGTAMTEDHVRLLARFSARRLVLAFDADAAGVAAVQRVYAWERDYGLDVVVADLPPGVDPDDMARDDRPGLHEALAGAVPLLRFRIDRVLAAGDMTSIEGRSRAARAAVEVVAEHPDGLVRDEYLVALADRCRIDGHEQRAKLRASLGAAVAGATNRDAGPGPAPVASGPSGSGVSSPDGIGADSIRLTHEDEALRLLIHRPEEVARWLAPCLFGDLTRREAYTALAETGDVLGAGDRAGEAAGRLLRMLAVDGGEADPDDVLAGIARWAGQRAMQRLARDARLVSDLDRRQGYNAAIAWVKEQTEHLAERDTRRAAFGRLLPWLVEHGQQEEQP